MEDDVIKSNSNSDMEFLRLFLDKYISSHLEVLYGKYSKLINNSYRTMILETKIVDDDVVGFLSFCTKEFEPNIVLTIKTRSNSEDKVVFVVNLNYFVANKRQTDINDIEIANQQIGYFLTKKYSEVPF